MKPVISSADLVRAFDVLRPSNEDQRRAIAELLGLAIRDPVMPVEPTPPPTAAPHVAQASNKEHADGLLRRPVTPSAVLKALDTGAGITVSGPSKLDSGSIPWTAAPGDFGAPAEPRTTIAVAPLFEPRWTRAILSTALAGKGATGGLNITELVNSVAKRQPLRSLPRLPGGRIAPRVDVLVDVSQSMMPFADDQTTLVAALRTVVGADAVRRMKFVGSPWRGAGTDEDDVWPDYSFPASGCHVVLLTDFGIGRPSTGNTLAGAGEWRLFAIALRKRRIGCTAFVPYPASRWPPDARWNFRIVQWDRATTAGNVKFSRGPALG